MYKKKGHFLFRWYSLRGRITFNIVLITIIPFFIASIFIYAYIRQNIIKENENVLNNALNDCSESVNRYISIYTSRSLKLVTNNITVTGINSFLKLDMEGYIEFQNYLMDYLADIQVFGSSFDTFTFVLNHNTSLDSKFIAKISDFKQTKQLKKILSSPSNRIIWNGNMKTDVFGRKFITFYINITQIINQEGFIEVNIPYANIEAYVNGVRIKDKYFIVHENAEKKLIYNNTNDINTNYKTIQQFDQKQFMFIKKELKEGAGSIAIAMPWSQINKDLNAVLSILIIIQIAFVVVIILTSRRTSINITSSLSNFIGYLKNNDELLLKEDSVVIGEEDEIALIKKKFISLIRKINEAYSSLMETKNQKNILEMELLQSRINPHLLYNTLSVIKWNALRQNDDKTVNIINAMTNYYRIALNKGNSIISVEKEVEMIREYVSMVNYSYGYSYEIFVNINEDVMKIDILKHLIQPLVENSIMHGLNGKKEGYIEIFGSKYGEYVTFEIEDNGYGMEKSVIEDILSLNYDSGYGGYGIKNIIKRIRIYYGESCGIEIKSEINRGTTVTIKIKNVKLNFLD